ncbi:MAG: ferritin-like domain-containing protein, partial [Deltaproteobacteria bacterium]|nr:ferritin-like domain-containing protein [Deltaproteobacteria bacterium]
MVMAAGQMRHVDAEIETILTSFDTNYAWNYGSLKEGLRDLYEKAKREQWNGTQQLQWDTQVDPESEIIPQSFNPLEDYGPYKKLDQKGINKFRHAGISWQLSQFMHGEQGALIVASQLTGAVPWMDAKYYAASQTMDEARHVEVFSHYLRDKLEWEWPINPNLKKL